VNNDDFGNFGDFPEQAATDTENNGFGDFGDFLEEQPAVQDPENQAFEDPTPLTIKATSAEPETLLVVDENYINKPAAVKNNSGPSKTSESQGA
jgi:hypothetical protein